MKAVTIDKMLFHPFIYAKQEPTDIGMESSSIEMHEKYYIRQHNQRIDEYSCLVDISKPIVEQILQIYPTIDITLCNEKGIVLLETVDKKKIGKKCYLAQNRTDFLNNFEQGKGLVLYNESSSYSLAAYPFFGIGHTFGGYLAGAVLDANKIEDCQRLILQGCSFIQQLFIQQQKQNKYERDLINAYPHGTLLLDNQGTILDANDAMKMILSLKGTSSLIGQNIYTLLREKPLLKKLLSDPRSDRIPVNFFLKENDLSIHCSLLSCHALVTPEGAKQFLLLFDLDQHPSIPLRPTYDKHVSPLDEIIGESPSIKSIKQSIKKIAPSSVSVLIHGESGTGKELVARAIHFESHRPGPFIAVNCGSIPRELLNSELFGYSEGAFTGALRGGKPGQFELADGGTLFLDEIGEMPMDMQVSLLRILQDNTVQRLGSVHPKIVNVRIIAASNRDLEEEMEKGKFRDDLYYRLSVINLFMPPLKERIEDIPLIVAHLMKNLCQHHRKPIPIIEPDALNLLIEHHWRGNIRELRNALENVLILNSDARITRRNITSYMETRIRNKPTTGTSFMQLEMNGVNNALRNNNGNITLAAKELGISRTTIYKKMKQFGFGVRG